MKASQAIVGRQYTITGGVQGQVGQTVTLLEAHHSGGDFQDVFGNELYKHFDNVEPKQTPCEKRGYKIGDKFVITSGYMLGDGNVVVTLVEDDGTGTPFFETSSGTRVCKDLDNIKPYVEPVLTPAQQRGYKEGDKFTVDGEDGVFTLSEDDNSSCPYFRDEDDNLRCLNLYELTPFVAPVAEAAVICGTSFVRTMKGWQLDTDVDLSFESRQAIRAIIDQQVFGAVVAVEAIEAVAVEAEPEVEAGPARKAAYRIIDNNNYHEFNIGDIVYKVEGTEYCYGGNRKGSGMSKDPAAETRGASGNVRYSDMEEVRAFRVVANTSRHEFAIGDIVYKVGKQSGESFSKPFHSMSKDPAATEKATAGEVYFTDVVAL